MLPSTGLFKSINCPFFESSSCSRPYCHFRHIKKDEEHLKIPDTVPVVKYNPTPIATILTKEKPPEISCISSKKPKLEYIPLPTKLSTIQSKKLKQTNTVFYKPTPCKTTKQNDIASNDTIQTEVETLTSEILIESEIETVEQQIETIQNVTPEKALKTTYNPTKVENKCQKEKSKSNKESKSTVKEKSTKVPCLSSENSNSSKHKSSSKDNKVGRHHESSSSHSKSSNSSSHRSSSSKNSHKDKEKSSSSSRSKSSSTSRTEIKATEESSRTNSRHDRKRKSSHSSSSEQSSKHDKIKSKKVDSKTEKKKKVVEQIIEDPADESDDIVGDTVGYASPCSIFDTDSNDEDEIMKQCRMIFEEFQNKNPKENTKVKKEVNTKRQNDIKVQEFNMFQESSSSRKRIAHETNNLPIRKLPEPVPKVNHVQNAMQSVYLRQEAVRKLQIESTKVEEPKPISTPLGSPTYNTNQMPTNQNYSYNNYNSSSNRQPSRIGAVTNVSALQLAKQKVEIMKQKQASRTIAHILQTKAQTSKNAARVAHTNTKPEVTTQPAPPVLEAKSSKISYNIRMQYYNLMLKHCLNIYPNCEDAWDRAQTEELAVMKKCSTPIIYKNSALLSINKLRKESMDAGNVGVERNNTISHDVMLAGKKAQKVSCSVNNIKRDTNDSRCVLDVVSSEVAYELVAECIMTEEQLKENGYPRVGPKPGQALITSTYKPKIRSINEEERYCSRCAKLYNLDSYDEPSVDECNYHPKGTGFRRGFADNLHVCCQQPAGTPGCMYANYHVSDYWDGDNLFGFVTTIDKDEDYIPKKKDLFALDCEMCYTTHGIELTRITVVDINEKIVYDSFVKPDNKIVDYNTAYSGITESLLKNTKTTLRDVQAILLSMFHSKTILIGHSLDSDLKALKLIHSVVVDTSILYPHKMGPPKKRALKTLAVENLKKIIQESDAGHDSSEDARACIGLVKHYLRNKIV